jgi:hypothetical protein
MHSHRAWPKPYYRRYYRHSLQRDRGLQERTVAATIDQKTVDVSARVSGLLDHWRRRRIALALYYLEIDQ